MMRAIMYFLIPLILIACEVTEKRKHSELVNKIVKEPFDSVYFKSIDEYIYPPHSYGIFMIPVIHGNSILLTDVDQLRSIHHYQYKEKDFSDFLHQVFSNELDVSPFLYYTHTAKVNDSFQSLKFEEFIAQYCTVIDSNTYQINKDYPIDSFYNVVYYLFNHNYLTSCGDYDGRCISEEVESVISKHGSK